MRILVLGASGMLGHKILLKMAPRHELIGAVRRENKILAALAGPHAVPVITGIDALKIDSIEDVIKTHAPDVVINCIGIVKQLKEAHDPYLSIAINALFPHQLKNLAHQHDFKLIHFSTDCVFSGTSAPYRETDPCDVSDLYGQTKYLGEVRDDPNALTIRSSIIGQEINHPTGLIEWFIAQRGQTINGYKHALYTGLTTNAMADLLLHILQNHPDLAGMHHVASNAISKYDLLSIANNTGRFNVTIKPDEDFHCDRRLDGATFSQKTGWTAPPWPEMIKTMFTEDRDYYKNTDKNEGE